MNAQTPLAEQATLSTAEHEPSCSPINIEDTMYRNRVLAVRPASSNQTIASFRGKDGGHCTSAYETNNHPRCVDSPDGCQNSYHWCANQLVGTVANSGVYEWTGISIVLSVQFYAPSINAGTRQTLEWLWSLNLRRRIFIKTPVSRIQQEFTSALPCILPHPRLPEGLCSGYGGCLYANITRAGNTGFERDERKKCDIFYGHNIVHRDEGVVFYTPTSIWNILAPEQ